jgi:hypothetical protein
MSPMRVGWKSWARVSVMGALQCGWAKSNLLIMVGGENMGISSNLRERATEVAVVMLEGGRWWTAFRD